VVAEETDRESKESADLMLRVRRRLRGVSEVCAKADASRGGCIGLNIESNQDCAMLRCLIVTDVFNSVK
jgi:hypothetical protein